MSTTLGVMAEYLRKEKPTHRRSYRITALGREVSAEGSTLSLSWVTWLLWIGMSIHRWIGPAMNITSSVHQFLTTPIYPTSPPLFLTFFHRGATSEPFPWLRRRPLGSAVGSPCGHGTPPPPFPVNERWWPGQVWAVK